jgi:hypothetical protein
MTTPVSLIFPEARRSDNCGLVCNGKRLQTPRVHTAVAVAYRKGLTDVLYPGVTRRGTLTALVPCIEHTAWLNQHQMHFVLR